MKKPCPAPPADGFADPPVDGTYEPHRNRILKIRGNQYPDYVIFAVNTFQLFSRPSIGLISFIEEQRHFHISGFRAGLIDTTKVCRQIAFFVLKQPYIFGRFRGIKGKPCHIRAVYHILSAGHVSKDLIVVKDSHLVVSIGYPVNEIHRGGSHRQNHCRHSHSVK